MPGFRLGPPPKCVSCLLFTSQQTPREPCSLTSASRRSGGQTAPTNHSEAHRAPWHYVPPPPSPFPGPMMPPHITSEKPGLGPGIWSDLSTVSLLDTRMRRALYQPLAQKGSRYWNDKVGVSPCAWLLCAPHGLTLTKSDSLSPSRACFKDTSLVTRKLCGRGDAAHRRGQGVLINWTIVTIGV